MGTIRTYIDATGQECTLGDHEGWVQAELVGPHPTAPYLGSQDPDGTWWTGGYSSGMPAATGRYRSGCDCGWTGPVINAATLPADQAELFRTADGGWTDWPSDDAEDIVMAPWREHTDAEIGPASLAALVAEWRAVGDMLGVAIARQVAAGVGWDDIARELGTTPAQARETWGHYDPPPGPVDQEWWDQLATDLRRATWFDRTLAESTSLLSGESRTAEGRQIEGWQDRTTEAMARALELAGIEVLAVVDVAELAVPSDTWRAPIGGVRVRRDGIEVLAGVRVDPVGEVYADVVDPADPRD